MLRNRTVFEIYERHLCVLANCFPTYQAALSYPRQQETSNLTSWSRVLLGKLIFPHLGLQMEETASSYGNQLQKYWRAISTLEV
jgi:hypothetical protein